MSKFKKRSNGFDENSWGRISDKVKNEISKKLLARHGIKCVYCERYLPGLGRQIDHFAHKALYGEFTFVSINLFYSCVFCNTNIKKQKETIQSMNDRYDLCTFRVVHPYLDNPHQEIIFQDSDKIILDLATCTPKGKATITFFEYEHLLMVTIRARTLIYERLHPYTSDEEKMLIQTIIAYK